MPIVDKFNVDGQDYAIEPVLDAVPMQNSQHAVMSGGVFADKSDVPVQGSTRNFTAAGAYDFFDGSKTSRSWLAKALAPMMFNVFHRYNLDYPDVFPDNNYKNYGTITTAGGIWYIDQNHNQNLPALYSYDLKSWQPVNISFIKLFGHSDGMAYHNGVWVIGNRKSTDGINFQVMDNAPAGTGTAYATVVFAGDKWFFNIYDGSTYTLYYSTDLETFTPCTGITANASPLGIKYAHGKYVGLRAGNGIWYSADGIAWAQSTWASGSWASYGGGTFSTATFASLYCFSNALYSGSGSGLYEAQHVWIALDRSEYPSGYSRFVFSTDDGATWHYSLAAQLPYVDRGYVSSFMSCGRIAYGADYRSNNTASEGLWMLDLSSLTATKAMCDSLPFDSVPAVFCINGNWLAFQYNTVGQATLLTNGLYLSRDCGATWRWITREATGRFWGYNNGTLVWAQSNGWLYSDVDMALEDVTD